MQKNPDRCMLSRQSRPHAAGRHTLQDKQTHSVVMHIAHAERRKVFPVSCACD